METGLLNVDNTEKHKYLQAKRFNGNENINYNTISLCTQDKVDASNEHERREKNTHTTSNEVFAFPVI